MEGPEYLDRLERQPENDHTVLRGANTYRLMPGMSEFIPSELSPNS